MPDDRTAEDARPQPPERPEPEDCCRSGCHRCVYDLYEEALDRYRAEVAGWEGRHAIAPREQGTRMETTATVDALVQAATQARERAYAPYSKFRVGAAVQASDGRVFAGCNVENASYGLSVCAERVAIFQAVAHGARDIVAIAVVTDAAKPAPPCGACRQVIAEFARDAEVVLSNTRGERVTATLAALLPDAFRLDPSG